MLTATSALQPHLSTPMLMWVCWLSCVIFSLHIVIFYGSAMLLGTIEREWDEVLLLGQTSCGAKVMIGRHFIAGTVVLMLDRQQFIHSVRAWARCLTRLTGA